MRLKSKSKSLLILPVILFAVSCNTLKEPNVDICIVVSPTVLHCIPVDPEKPEYEIESKDSIGYFCASPNDYGQVKKHHDELHRRLKEKP